MLDVLALRLEILTYRYERDLHHCVYDEWDDDDDDDWHWHWLRLRFPETFKMEETRLEQDEEGNWQDWNWVKHTVPNIPPPKHEPRGLSYNQNLTSVPLLLDCLLLSQTKTSLTTEQPIALTFFQRNLTD